MTAWQLIVIAFAVLGIIVWSVWLVYNKGRWKFAVAPISYFAHVLIFYAVVYFCSCEVTFLNNWSNAVRLHGELLFVGVGFLTLLGWRRKWIFRL